MVAGLTRSRHLGRAIGLLLLLVFSGCTTQGSNFDANGLALLVPGHTSLAQASALLKSDPIHVYRQGDGSALAVWGHHASFVPDAVYFRRQLWLAFDANGHYTHVVTSSNVPQSWALPHTAEP